MASDGNTGKIPVASLVQGSRAANLSDRQSGSGKSLPPIGNGAATAQPQAIASASPAVPAAAAGNAKPPTNPIEPPVTDPQSLVSQLNKYLNDSGRPNQFQIDTKSGGKLIQEVNPATGEVVGEFSVSEFPALARSLGASSLLVDSLA